MGYPADNLAIAADFWGFPAEIAGHRN